MLLHAALLLHAATLLHAALLLHAAIPCWQLCVGESLMNTYGRLLGSAATDWQLKQGEK